MSITTIANRQSNYAKNNSVSTVSAGFSSETYLAGSAVTLPVAGGLTVGAQYWCLFDMVKTAAGVATPIIRIYLGTNGTTADTVIATLTFGAGTAAADTGLFQLFCTIRTIGSGTSANIQTVVKLDHALAATGLSNTGAAGTGILINTSAFNSTVGTKLGISFNGGASFSGTNTLVQSEIRL